MTTDKTPATLATVKHGGCVQLGDWPWPEIDAILADAYSAGAEGLPFGGIARRAAVRAALAAQPSPGGQGDALLREVSAQLESLDCGACIGSDAPMEDLHGRIAAHLAARQPVGSEEAHVLPPLATERMLDVGWPYGEVIDANFDRQGAYADLVAAAPPAQAVDLGTGVKAIAAERERQLQAEGFTRDSDRQYQRGELAKAATAYVQLAAMDLAAGGTRDHIAWHGPAAVWPWAPEWWKPVDARHDLVRAGALIAAQIDLIDSQAVGNG